MKPDNIGKQYQQITKYTRGNLQEGICGGTANLPATKAIRMRRRQRFRFRTLKRARHYGKLFKPGEADGVSGMSQYHSHNSLKYYGLLRVYPAVCRGLNFGRRLRQEPFIRSKPMWPPTGLQSSNPGSTIIPSGRMPWNN